MNFRSAMCPNCECNLKLESDSTTTFCARCGIQLQAQDAFVYYDLKNGDGVDIDKIGSYSLLFKCGREFLEQKKHDLADACFVNMLKSEPDDYQIWKLRALSWESRVVNDYRKAFYEYKRGGTQADRGRTETGRGGIEKSGSDFLRGGVLTENKEFLDKYREYCNNAVRCCPADMAEELADEFNDRIRSHFDIAYRAYKRDRRNSTAYALLAAGSFFALAAVALKSCGTT